MVTVTYECDKCGHEQKDATQMWTVRVLSTHGYIAPSLHISSPASGRNQMLVCRKCLLDLGLIAPSPEEKKVERPAPPTLEDLIREIIIRCREDNS